MFGLLRNCEAYAANEVAIALQFVDLECLAAAVGLPESRQSRHVRTIVVLVLPLDSLLLHCCGGALHSRRY